MNIEELINFNPILAKAMAEADEKTHPIVDDGLRELVAASVRAGVSPNKIYALIKTGRFLTRTNMKFLTFGDTPARTLAATSSRNPSPTIGLVSME